MGFKIKEQSDLGSKGWLMLAKICGGLLNLNCSLLLLPVLRGLLRRLNNTRVGATGTIASYIPLRKNVVFHKLMAKYVAFLAAVHVFAHIFVHSSQTVTAFKSAPTKAAWYGELPGVAPWITGGAICIAMLLIYTAAAPEYVAHSAHLRLMQQCSVKHADYEIFWFCHHFFTVFYICLVFHGPVFLYWAVLPIW